jgi:16S rRNA (adenine1518-N6/adenine1519-N6)-dimethyltransferase
MNKKTIIEITQNNNLYPNRKLGQNFICNEGILKKIIEVSEVDRNDNVLEIGPGLGALTSMLAEKSGSVTAVEIDSGLYHYLEKKFGSTANLRLIHADFLRLDPRATSGNSFTRVIANLPYYCSSEILFQLALKYETEKIFVMLQKEMAERITAKPGTKAYGALTVTLGLYYETSNLFNIDRRSFYPEPEVSSSFLQLSRKETTGLDRDESELFHKIVKSVFWARRKTLIKSLLESPHLDFSRETVKAVLSGLNIDENIRAEKLGVENFKDIARKIKPANLNPVQ